MKKYIGMRLKDALEVMDQDIIVSLGAEACYLKICSAHEMLQKLDTITEKSLMILKESLRRTKIRKTNLVNKHNKAFKAEIKRCEEAIRSTQNKLDEFIPFPEREIIDVYQRINPDDGICIIVGGCEIGRLWYHQEAK